MKSFEFPVCEMIELNGSDIITKSPGGNETPVDWGDDD
jgi:hypothetical protein